mmetsp:Transcript_6053/g.13299  ORF Transcript_6053/g.13299 Transcript_6053/m.13299 type:complete len:98 (-) Transcript_6053:182-475(-)
MREKEGTLSVGGSTTSFVELDERSNETGLSSRSEAFSVIRPSPSHRGWKYDRDAKKGGAKPEKKSYSLFGWPGIDYENDSCDESLSIDIGDYSLHAF